MKIWKAAGLALGVLGAIQPAQADDNTMTPPNTSERDMYEHHPLYRANEFSLDLFGMGSVGKESVEHLSTDRLSNDSRLGAGAGLNYFFTRNVGISVDAYTESTRHFFVDSASANMVGRFPIGESLVAPYIFGGAGHQFERREQWFGDAGAGIEFRFTPHFGLFLDGRWVLADKTDNYGVGRAGLRFAF